MSPTLTGTDLNIKCFSPPPPELPALKTPACKRARTDGDDNFETEDFPTSVPATPMPHANILTFGRRYAVDKNLKPAQMQEVLDFVKRPLDERFLMLFVICIQSRDNEASLARALASWVPSSTTEAQHRSTLKKKKRLLQASSERQRMTIDIFLPLHKLWWPRHQ